MITMKEINKPQKITFEYIQDILNNYFKLGEIIRNDGIFGFYDYLKDKDITKPYYKELNTYVNDVDYRNIMIGTLENELPIYVIENYISIVAEVDDINEHIDNIINIINKYYKLSIVNIECIRQQIYKIHINYLISNFSLLIENICKYPTNTNNTISKLLSIYYLEKSKSEPFLLQVRNNEPINTNYFEGDLLNYMLNNYNAGINDYANGIANLCDKWFNIKFNNDSIKKTVQYVY